MVIQKDISFSTSGYGDMHDLTDQIGTIVSESQVKIGTVHIFAVGSTAGICSIEFEPGLQKDLPQVLSKLIPPGHQYGHEQAWHDGNGHSHLQASIIGPELTVPIRDGRLMLGTWQQVVHVEFDIRSRRREVVVTLHAE